MSFPSNSAFDQGAAVSPRAELADIPVRHVGRPNIIEIPEATLESWIALLEEIVDVSRDPDLEDVIHDMRSRFRG